MAEIIKSIEVDVAKQNTFKAIVAKQGDKSSRFLKVQLLNEGTKIAVESGALVTINAERSDTQARAFKGEVNADGTVNVPLTAWILEIDGQVKCSVSVVQGEDRLTSTSFAVLVEHAEFCDETIYEDDEADLFVQLLHAAESEDARVTAENERLTAEAQRIEAEKARQTAETARQSAEATRNGAESARNAAEIARETKVEELVEESTNATQDAKNAAQQVASALLAGGMIPIYNEDENKNYTFQLIIRNGYPVLSMIEAE